MPAAPRYPGVYIQEVPSGVHTIAPVSTSTTAFIGSTERGSVNEPIHIVGFADFQRAFGDLDGARPLGYCVQHYFQNGGKEAYVVRVARGATTAAVTLRDARRPVLDVAASSPGAWGNGLRIDVDYDASDPSSQFNLRVFESVKRNGVMVPVRTEVFRDLTLESADPNYAVALVNAQSQLVRLTRRAGLTDAAATLRPLPTGTTGTVRPGKLPSTGTLTIDVMKGAGTTPLAAAIPVPVWGGSTMRPVPATLDDAVVAITAALSEIAAAQPLPTGATAQRIGNTVRIVPGGEDPNISLRFKRGGIAWRLGLDAAAARNVGHYALGVGVTALGQVQVLPVGDDGAAPGDAELIGNEALKTGLYALEKLDLFNLLVIPEASVGAGRMTVLTEAIAYCTRRRAFMIIVAPETVATCAEAQTWMSETASPLRSRSAAIYFPRLRAPDPMKNGVVGTFPAAGALAGLYVRTDVERGVWQAPAGTGATIIGATGLSYTLTDRENGTLNPLALNALRVFPTIGTVAWGARTGRGADTLADEYKYVPVRRLALFIEESLDRGLKWVVSEPNGEPLWSQIRLNVGAFMQTLFRQGAFQGQTPREAYFVKCDRETTTQNDIDTGRVNIMVGFAPMKPAEFVIIRIQQLVSAP
jgi:phage tail sheath protein FI